MTVLTFPSNPIVGQQYAAPNGVQYVYDGVKWIVETISSSSEAVSNSTQDRVAPMFVDGDNTGITFTYDAGTNTLSAAVTAVNGDTLVNGQHEFTLGSDGTLTLDGDPFTGSGFTVGTVDLHNGGVQSAQILQFDDSTFQSVITGPSPAPNGNAQRLIIQGQKGNGTGEGGDVYLWGGDANNNGGDIKIYAGHADEGVSGDQGGYVYLEGGYGFTDGGDIRLSAGSSSVNGGTIRLVSGGGANPGDIQLQADNRQWTFNPDGSLLPPQGEVVDGTSWNNSFTQPTLSLGRNTGDVTITDTASDVDHRGNRNILIQGERGFYANGEGGTGAGGKGTSINIIGGLGGESSEPNNGGEGGTVNIKGGTGQHGGAGGGWVNIRGGDAAEWNDAAGSPSGGQVNIKGGNAYSLPTGKGFGGDVFLQAGQGENGDGSVRVETYNREKGQWNYWAFSTEGSLELPQGYSLSRAQSVWINAGSAPTVAYTSIDSYVGSIKATIKVLVQQADIGGDFDVDTQVCEMLIAVKRRFIDNGGTWVNTAVGTVYGVTHTSTAPLATFTVNFVQGYVAGPGIPPKDVVQILAEPTAAVTGTNMWVMVAATEMTND